MFDLVNSSVSLSAAKLNGLAILVTELVQICRKALGFLLRFLLWPFLLIVVGVCDHGEQMMSAGNIQTQ
jgi:hypothetical protein